MKLIKTNQSKICCRFCGCKDLRYSHQHHDLPAASAGGMLMESHPATKPTQILRCMKCDRFTPLAR